MERRIVGLLIFILILGSVGFIIAYVNPIPNPGHGGDEVYIKINGNNLDLQTAIDNGNFSSEFTGTGSYSLSVLFGHLGDEVVVNVNGSVKTLQQAINDGSLCSAEAGSSPSEFEIVPGQNQNGDEIWINFSGEKTLQQAINNGDFYKCIPGHCGYELVSFGVYATCEAAVPWAYVVENSQVVGPNGNLMYSTTQGNWLPTNTYDTGLRLNVDGERAVYCGRHPQSYLRAIYRVWGDTKVSVNTQSWAENVCATGGKVAKLSRTDTFERLDETTILVNGNPQVINAGESYDVQRVTWNPGDHGSGESYVRVTNDACTDYFDVISYVAEIDEQCDSSRVWIDGYIESA